MGWFTKTRDRLKRSSSRTPPKPATSSIPVPEPALPAPAPQSQPSTDATVQGSEGAPIEAQPDPASDTTSAPPSDETHAEAQQELTVNTTSVQSSSTACLETQPDSHVVTTFQHEEIPQVDAAQDQAKLEDIVIIKGLTRADTVATLLENQNVDKWSAAFEEAMKGLDDMKRAIVMEKSAHDIHELFARLDDADSANKKESLIRKGMDRVRTPLTWLDAALSAASPLAAVEPVASTAFGVARGVTTLAIGICGVEARLSDNIKQMLQQIAVIDDCDDVVQSFESKAIHNALVTVYKDLLTFYCSATEMLARQVTVLALLSEQLNERLPPLVKKYVEDSTVLRQHVQNATDAIMKKIEKIVTNLEVERLLGAHSLKATWNKHRLTTQSISKEACKWSVEDATFTAWLGGLRTTGSSTNRQMLALFGTMGCGKTLTMAFLIEHVLKITLGNDQKHRDRQHNEGKQKVLQAYYYCTSDETGRPLAVYSSLIQQLMDSKPSLKVLFMDWEEEQREKGVRGQTQDPSLLAQFLIKAIKSIHRPIFIFVDGLDECNDHGDGGAEDIISFLRECTEASAFVRVCVSARNQQYMKDLLAGSLTISVPQGESRDTSIVEHIVQDKLRYMKPDCQKIVITGLSRKANGSAIWVRLAVDLLAKRKYRHPGPVSQFIQEIPQSTFQDLYGKLFSQVTEDDEVNSFTLSTALEILAIAERPMSIAEVSWAVALVQEAREEGEAGSKLCLAGLIPFIDPDGLLEFLNPFIVSVGLDYDDVHARQIRLNHHSVREHVMLCSPQQWPRLAANPELARNKSQIRSFQEELHGRLARHCVRYLLMDDLKGLNLFSREHKNTQMFDELGGLGFLDDSSILESDTEEHATGSGSGDQGISAESSEGTQAQHISSTALPDADADADTVVGFYNPADRGFGEFFVYASCYWLEHMHKANIQVEDDGLVRRGSSDSGYGVVTSTTTSATSKVPISFHEVQHLASEESKQAQNWWEQFYRSDCTLVRDETRPRPRFRDALTLLALFGSDSQLREAVQYQLVSPAPNNGILLRLLPFRNAVEEVLRIGNPERLPQLLSYERGRDLAEVASLFGQVLEAWGRDQWISPHSGHGNDAKYALIFDHMLKASDFLVEQGWGNELLCLAASHGCLPFIERLFILAEQSEAFKWEILRCDERQSPCNHQSVGLAAWNGHTTALEYLLAQDGVAEGHLRYRDNKGNTVLHMATRKGDARMMQLLCERMPDAIEERADNGDTALQKLVFDRRAVELITIMLELGRANVRSGYNVPGACKDCDPEDLVTGPDGDLSDWHEPLRMAARYEDLEMCRALIMSSGRLDLLWVVAVESEDIAAQLRHEFCVE